jgi:hypothetical protein
MPPKAIPPPPTVKKWGPVDANRLAELIELEGVIDLDDPAHLTLPYIDQIRLDHFRHFAAKNFRLNYRNKLRDYCLGEELDGARRRIRDGKSIYIIIIIMMYSFH